MNFIDIASWQKGIDLAALFAQNPLDGVVIKATEGTGYVNSEYAAWVMWLTDNKKPFGVYHYLDTADPAKQAEHFYNTVKAYIGKCVPCADYEADALSKGTAFLKKFLDRFYALSGVKCMIYCSLSVVQSQDFTSLTDHPLWIAQYADMNPVYGFVDTPWQKGSVSPFAKYWMQQYTSCGLLKGWGGKKYSYDENGKMYETITGKLDFDKFWGTAEDWTALGKGNAPQAEPSAPSAAYKKTDPAIVLRTLKNEFGIGTNRTVALRELGYDPADVQKTINRLYVTAGKVKKDIGGDMSYLNSILWIVRSI